MLKNITYDLDFPRLVPIDEEDGVDLKNLVIFLIYGSLLDIGTWERWNSLYGDGGKGSLSLKDKMNQVSNLKPLRLPCELKWLKPILGLSYFI